MKKRIFIIIISILINFHTAIAQEQTLISGKIVGKETKEPLVGALIKVNSSDLKTSVISDYKGVFSILLPHGKYTLLISFLGYEPKEVEINSNNPHLGAIELQVSGICLNEIILSASSQNYKKDFKGSNYLISASSIQNTNPLNTEEILRKVPGINIVGDMGLSNRPNISIRGSWGRRSKKILLMEDGSPSAPAPYIAPGAYYNPVSDRIKAIEVYKGADMLRYGPNNMYGAVNYITALPPQKPALRLKLVGGQRNYKTALMSYGGTWSNLGALIEGVYKKFDGFTDNSQVDILNLNAKIFTKLSDKQSLYFKVSGQFEDNKASLSSQTPFTFEQNPKENPFDADQFTMHRYGLDIIHKWAPNSNINLTSKLYASNFERDWWKQVTTKIKASEVENYVGAAVFNERYSHLKNAAFTDEDYVRVGKITDGKESTTDSRWAFTVSGIQETFKLDWRKKHKLEIGIKLHQETYTDRSLSAANSRWVRSGTITNDLEYYLWSASGYLRNEFRFKSFGITPILRYEHINMYRQDLLALTQNNELSGIKDGREHNNYNVVMPGITLDHKIADGAIFGSIYKGFIAPSKVFGFLVEKDGVVTNPFLGESINIKPELSLNTEIGWRGSLLNSLLNGQVTYFNNTIHNFYAGGRNEVFETLGKINIRGWEIALETQIFRNANNEVRFFGNATLLKSKILQGSLWDKDLFGQVIHNNASTQEYLTKVNSHRASYEIYRTDEQGNENMITKETITNDDFSSISKSVLILGGKELDTEAPYTPRINFTTGFNYRYKKFGTGISGSYVDKQYTEYNNFEAESADGSIGALPSYFTMDAFANYEFTLKNQTQISVFINGKNITNNIYKASRLNRASSGIFPGGFRQLIFGVNLTM